VLCIVVRKSSVRSGSRITKTGILPWSPELQVTVNSKTAGTVFKGIGGGWNGSYHPLQNNCIHYALKCWMELGGKATWNDVCDGNNSILFDDDDPGGRECILM